MRRIIPVIAILFLQLSPAPLLGNPPLTCEISVTGDKTRFCQGQPLVLIAKVDEGLSETKRHVWETRAQLLSDPDKPYVKFDTGQPGVYIVEYQAWNEAGMQALCSLEIEVVKSPEPQIVENFGFFRRILFKKPILEIQINSIENHTFQWFFNDDPVPGAIQPEFRPRKAGRYQVRVTSQEGCSAFTEEKIVE